MTTEQYTRCPHCKATFKVTDDQLAAAGGRVRCGACMNVFDALTYALNTEMGGDTDSENADHAAPATPPPEKRKPTSHQAKPTPEPEAAPEPEPEPESDDDMLFEDNPEEDAEEGRKPATALSSDLSDSFLSLDKKENSASPYNDSYEEEEETDESWTEKVLEEASSIESTVDGRKEPSFGDKRPTAYTTNTTNTTNTKPAQTISENLNQATKDVEAIDFLYQETETVRARSVWSRLAIGIACFALVLLLMAQAAWFHYEKLAKYPLAKQAFATACDYIGCSLPELSDLSKIRSHNLIVRSHPSAAKALIIDAVVTNEAPFAQDFPKLALYFSDINDQVVAQQVISPDQYLSQEILSWGQMPSDQAIHISIEIEDPGKEAVNYKIRFFPNKNTHQE